jgi:hypothetical protein
LRDGQVPVLVRHEAAFVHVPGQDPVQGRSTGQGRRTLDVRMLGVESIEPEQQRLNIADDIFNVIFHEGKQPQAAGRNYVPLDHGRARWLAQRGLHAGHIPLADLLGDEVAP